jgi:long-chain acyl-CoA synthetase
VNLANILEHGRSDAPALVHGAETWTYAALRAAVADLAIRLSAEGCNPGDHVGLLAANNPSFVVGAFGALTAGLVVVPLNPQSPPLELARELALTEVRLVLADDAAAAAHGAATRALGADRIVPIAPQRFAGPAPTAHRSVGVGAEAPAFLLFTSGTAGPPAAATLLHGNLRANLEQVAAHPGAAIMPADVVLGVAPLGHVFGLNAVLNPALAAGACVVLVEHFDAASTLALIGARRVTIVSGPPALWDALAGACHDPTVFGTVRLALSGAAPLEHRTVEAVHVRCGLRLQQGYGLTEAAPVVAMAVGTDAPASSVGVPLPGLEVRIVDELGADVLIGDEGELWVRGSNVFAGYWGDPDATDRALTRGGWLRTGDIAVVDENGWISLVDRMKDLIIVSGFNVHPGEVESVLLAHPAVREAVVIGVAHSGTGERVEATVVLDETGANADDLVAHCRERLARYKVPSVVQVVDALPHGLTGKVLRRELRPD